MSTTCLHCGSPIQSLRSTKKYCSDNCKQLAFYKRNALGVEREQTQDTRTLIDSQIASDNVIHQPELIFQTRPDLTITEPPYQHLFSGFIEEVTFHVEKGDVFRTLQNPDKFWSNITVEAVRWVSVRLRCLVENLIRFSDVPGITKQTLRVLLKAFRELLASNYFQKLPSSYPYLALTKGLEAKMTMLLKQGRQYQSIRFRLSSSRKAELIAVRFILAGIVPSVKFWDLKFKN